MSSILVVEDENIVAMDLAATLRRLGYDVVALATRGEDAVELVRKHKPDLVLMDIMLAGPMDGIQAAEIIRGERDVPVVFLTAYSDDRTIARAGQTEAYGFIVKPFHDRDIKSAVEVALHKHRGERAKQGRSEWLAKAFHAIGDGVIACDAEGHVTFVNPVAERLTGWSASEAAGRPLSDVFRLVSVDGGGPVADPVARALETRLPVLLPDRTSLIARDGSDVPIDDCAAPIFDEAGTPIGGVLVFRDGTARRRLQARLLLADRVASVGVMAAGIGHEVANPLAYILANLEYAIDELSRGSGEAERIVEALREARHGTERVTRIARQLRAWSRSDEERPKLLKLPALLDTAVSMAWAEIRHRSRLLKDYGPVPDVTADEPRLTQAFIVLLVNAAHAIPEGQSDTHSIRISTSTVDGRAVVSIADTGAGIAPENVPHVFDPFSTAPGAGIGLAVAHSAVTALGGTLTVESTLGKGSTFTVSLPGVPAAAVVRTRPRVLIIDDEAMICGAVQRALSDESDVTAVSSAREALARFRAGERWDVVLMDILMPEMGGIELFEAVGEVAPEQAERVIFLTGGAFTKRASDFLAAGKRFLEKPFDTSELKRIVNGTLR